jgi:hypothetical protein
MQGAAIAPLVYLPLQIKASIAQLNPFEAQRTNEMRHFAQRSFDT